MHVFGLFNLSISLNNGLFNLSISLNNGLFNLSLSLNSTQFVSFMKNVTRVVECDAENAIPVSNYTLAHV